MTENIDLNYLNLALNMLNLNNLKKKSGQPLITQSIVYSQNILLPPPPEQRRIAEILSVVDKKLELEKKRKEKFVRIKKKLMNDLLSGRKRIKNT